VSSRIHNVLSRFKCPKCGTIDTYIGQIAKFSKNKNTINNMPKEARVGECQGIKEGICCDFVWNMDIDRNVYI
jgi:hypothetical protein